MSERANNDPGRAARKSALWLMATVQDGALLAELLPKLNRLEPQERARAQRLAEMAFRWSDRADRMLGPYLRLKPRMQVLNALRLGVIEMAVDKAAPHGVLNSLVGIVRSDAEASGAAGLTNAVLRKVSQNLDMWDTLAMPRLPKKMRARMVKAYDKTTVAAFEAAHVAGAPLDVTLRDVAVNPFERLPHEVLPTGSIRLRGPGQVSTLPGFSDGAWWVQDAAAALPARILAAQPGERVLDLCAAPGGKTMQLAATGAEVTALDSSQRRMERVSENLARTKLSADLVTQDALTYAAKPFDAILLDAPCSATGTIRRHPDLPIAKAGLDFSDLVTLQAQMLDRAVGLLKPGGRMVFCTCSLFPEEGEQQADAALQRHAGLVLDVDALRISGVEKEWMAPNGLRLRPNFWADRGGLDGFFISAFRKSA